MARRMLLSADKMVAGMNSFLNQQVLVLNRLWQAVNICTARRALTLLFEGRAQVVLDCADGSFQTYNFSQWHDFSQQEPHPESIHTISFRTESSAQAESAAGYWLALTQPRKYPSRNYCPVPQTGGGSEN